MRCKCKLKIRTYFVRVGSRLIVMPNATEPRRLLRSLGQRFGVVDCAVARHGVRVTDPDAADKKGGRIAFNE